MSAATDKSHEPPSDGSASSAARSQLSTARTQLAQVQELLKGVEKHLDSKSNSNGRRRCKSYRRHRTYSPQCESALSRKAELERDISRRHSTTTEEDPRSFDVKSLKSEMYRLKTQQQKLAQKAHDLRLKKELQKSHKLIRSKSDEGSDAPRKNITSSAAIVDRKELHGVLRRRNKSFEDLRTNKRVSFIRTPMDPEDQSSENAQTPSGQTEVVIEYESSPYSNAVADDESILSLFPITDSDAKSMSNTVMAIVEPSDNNSINNAKTNNNQKMFRKSLDRPTITRRNSDMSSPKVKSPHSYSKRNSDPCHLTKSTSTQLPSKQGRIDTAKQSFLKYVNDSSNGRNRFS